MEDLRIKKTKQAIKTAFLSLVEEVGFDNVRVNDIASRALINRNTFYLHYESKEDLVQKLANEALLLKFSSMDFESIFKSRSKRKIHEVFRELMNEVEANIDIYRIYLINPAMAGYLRISLNIIMEKMFTFMKKTTTTKLQIEYLFAGITGIVSKWIVYATGSKEEVADVLTDMTYASGRQMYLSAITAK